MTARLCEANASFSSTRSSVVDVDAGAREQLAARRGPGRCPSRAGRRPRPRCRRTRRAARCRARAPSPRDAITSAAAPSLMPGRVAGRDGAALAERRLQRGELLERRVGPRMLVARRRRRRRRARRRSGPASCRGRPALLRRERERVLVLARDAAALGDVLARLAHRLEREHLLQLRVREAPAERRVVQRRGRRAGTPCPASPSTNGARDIDSTPPATKRSPSPAITAWHAPTTAERPGRAEPVDGDARDRLRQAGEQRAPCARRCGCPRPPGSRSRTRRPRSRPPERRSARRPRGSTSAARSSGRTPESAPP